MTVATRSFKDWLVEFFAASEEDSKDFEYISNLKSLYEDDLLADTKESPVADTTPYSTYIIWVRECGFTVKVRASDNEGKAYVQRKTLVKPTPSTTTKGF